MIMTPVHPRLLIVPFLLFAAAVPAGDAPLYSTDFSKLAPGKLPEDQFLVLAGEFAVKDIEGNRLLELPGAPLDSFGLMFGPAGEATGTVGARIWGASTRRRFPEFGIGANDTGGYKLWLVPLQKRVEVRKGDQTVAAAPYESWKTGTWTQFRLQVGKAGEGAWTVRGKIWPGDTDEPKDWSVSFDEKDEPTAGRASVWGNPYSGQPIRFDDLRVER